MGGYFSVKRNTMSMNGNTFVRPDQVVAYCKALLEVFRCALQLTSPSYTLRTHISHLCSATAVL